MKKNHMLFTILFAIYIAAGVISIILFYTKGSYLSRELAAAATETTVESPDPAPETPDTPAEPDLPEEPAKPEVSEEPETPAEPDEPAEPETPAESTDTDVSDTSEDTSETEPAEDQAAEETDSEDDGKTYYGFTVIDGVTGVRIRETEDRNSKTVSHIDGGKSGYVLERGDTRSKILTKKGTIGYIYNEYLTFTEIPKTDFPEEYR